MLATISPDAVKDFMTDIEDFRKSRNLEEWKEFVSRDESLRKWQYFLTHDPYTRWGLVKPRGYAGDATLMDFAYRHRSIEQYLKQSSELGLAIYAHTSSARQSNSARDRTKFIADILTKLCDDKTDVSVASFASGHGRELELLSEDTCSRISKFVAVDSDTSSLQILKHTFNKATCVPKNVFRVRIKEYGEYDFVYSLGLFDYLKGQFATSLLDRMWHGLKGGGKLLIANLNNNAANIAYCEGIMDWWMFQRSEDELHMLGEHLHDHDNVSSIAVHTIGCFSYLTVTKSR